MGAIRVAGMLAIMSSGGTTGGTIGGVLKLRLLSTGVTCDRTNVSTTLPGMRMILTLATLIGIATREATGGLQ